VDFYYVPFTKSGRREVVRRMPNGQRSVFATLPMVPSPKPMLWVNGIASGPDGFIYVTDNDAIRKIDKDGNVSVGGKRLSSSVAMHDATAVPGAGTKGLPNFCT
jgi:hypothetical protein